MKNKKLFILICIPLIISIMVLPLCSFMPSIDDSSPSYDYSPSYGSNVDVGLDFRMYSIIDDFDYELSGFVDDVLNCSVNYIQPDPNDPTLYPNISYESIYVSPTYKDTVIFYLNDLAADYPLSDGRFVCDYSIEILPTEHFDEGTEYTTESFLNGSFNITYSPKEISNNDIVIDFYTPSGDLLDLSNFNIEGEIIYEQANAKGSYHKYVFDSSPISDYLFGLDSIYLSTYDLALNILLPNPTITPYRILSFNFTLIPPDHGITRFRDYAVECYVSSQIIPVDYAESQYIDWITSYNEGLYDIGYETGYDYGYDVGVVSGIDPWKGVSDFLVTTVGGFLDFEFVEGISFGGILSLFLGIILVFTFLKIFAGG